MIFNLQIWRAIFFLHHFLYYIPKDKSSSYDFYSLLTQIFALETSLPQSLNLFPRSEDSYCRIILQSYPEMTSCFLVAVFSSSWLRQSFFLFVCFFCFFFFLECITKQVVKGKKSLKANFLSCLNIIMIALQINTLGVPVVAHLKQI